MSNRRKIRRSPIPSHQIIVPAPPTSQEIARICQCHLHPAPHREDQRCVDEAIWIQSQMKEMHRRGMFK